MPGTVQSPVEWFRAVRTEVKTRFILEGKTNCKPHPILLDIAESILLKDMQASVQSAYLQLQYVVFLSAYRENFEQSKLKLDVIERTMNVNLGLQYSIYRKRKDLDRLRQQHESQNADQVYAQVGYEDIQKREAIAAEEHDTCKARLLQVWAGILQFQKGADNALRLASLLEAAAMAETRAQNAFVYVLYRCQEAEAVYRKYAMFLTEIQDNVPLATELLEHAENLRAQTTAASGESKSQGSTSKNSNQQADQRKRLRIPDKSGYSNIWLTLKLRSATLLLVAVVIGLFIRTTRSIVHDRAAHCILTQHKHARARTCTRTRNRHRQQH